MVDRGEASWAALRAAEQEEMGDAVAVLTDWEAYKTLDFERIYAAMEKPAFLFDGRNMLDHAALHAMGFEVYSIGKGRLSHLD